ncbi:MAG: hypothetical protein ACKOA2_10955 [Ilumatobacteraceae bacterium]
MSDEQPEQLTLLESSLPAQFRLDRRTRERGLAHVAAIRAQLAANAASRAASAEAAAAQHRRRSRAGRAA